MLKAAIADVSTIVSFGDALRHYAASVTQALTLIGALPARL